MTPGRRKGNRLLLLLDLMASARRPLGLRVNGAVGPTTSLDVARSVRVTPKVSTMTHDPNFKKTVVDDTSGGGDSKSNDSPVVDDTSGRGDSESNDVPVVDDTSGGGRGDSKSIDYNVGDCCVTAWTRKEWYLTHITSINLGVVTTFDVYFPGDGKSKKGLRRNQIRDWKTRVSTPPVRRTDLLGKDWWFEGDEEVEVGSELFKVRRLNGNKYVCTRLSGDCPVNIDGFDIGFVTREFRKHEEKVREVGVVRGTYCFGN